MSTHTKNDGDTIKTIAALDDATATRVLRTVINPRIRAGECTTEWAPDLGPALREEFNLPAATGSAVPGELARQTLLLLCQDERYCGPIVALAKSAPTERTRFAVEPVSGTLLITAALFALQSHIEITRDKDGRWTFKFVKKSTKDAIISPLIKKLIALVSGGPPTPQ